MSLKEKQVNIRLTEEQYSEIEEKSKQSSFSSISEYLRYAALNKNPEICRCYLFWIEFDNEDSNALLTSFVHDIRIEEDKISITFILDEKNTWKKFLEAKRDFKIWWMSRKGEKIDYFGVHHYMYSEMKIFPLHFSHTLQENSLAMAILKS
jgi:hypothetical protein